MDEAAPLVATRRRLLEPAVAITIVVLDQITKELIRRAVPLYSSTTVVPGLLDFTHVPNTGAAFGFLDAANIPFKAALLAGVACITLVGVTAYTLRLPREQIFARLGLSLILGGAAGNLIDRVFTGWVVDFVDVYWRGHHFWAFNVADSAISVGVALMILDMIGVGRHVSRTV